MILNARNKKPKISFGLGKRELTISSETLITVWLENIFNVSVFDFTIMGVPMKRKSDYEYEIEPLEPGSYEINMLVSNRNKKGSKDLKSNTLTLTVE